MSEDFPSSDDMKAIDYKPLHGVAYEKLVSALQQGRFKPGSVLRTRAMAKALGVSSTPVREALGQLIAQSVLDVDPRNRAAIVPGFTKELLDELYSIRSVLDDLVAEAAVENITNEEVEKLRRLAKKLEEMDSSPESESYPLYLKNSQEFFFTIYESTRRPILLQLIDDLWLRSSVILGHIHRKQPENFSIAKERNELVDAIAKRNVNAIKKALKKNLTKTQKMIFKVIDQE